MAKVIYAIKIWLFREQIKLTAVQEKGIREFALFAVIVYAKAWATAPIPQQAPLNDFLLMESLLKYPHEAISKSTTKKLSHHLWYLSEELVGMSLSSMKGCPGKQSS